MEQTAAILRIERSSIYDGQGLRTVVFFKGCPLRCAWCSTPESQNPLPEQGENYSYGREMTVEQVMAEISKDEIFFFHSGGGVTLSGGEPLCQADFAAEILRQSQRLGVDTAMESSLCLPWNELAKVLPHLNTLYADIKLMDGARHRRYCGADNSLILSNLRWLAAWEWPLKLIIRMPLIPTINDDEQNLYALAQFCRELKRVEQVELLPYHRLGVHTYAELGREYTLSDIKTPSAAYMAAMRRLLGHYLDKS